MIKIVPIIHEEGKLSLQFQLPHDPVKDTYLPVSE